ncbi:hypothetical protein [Dyadobacter sp. MSC1_007]|jgi:hypothetical protein|uniref:hypothetical protein n=1 Tax=Dyadobacter sp. MSC1_007 TaxID=2909264 RepID=UPI00202F5A65|nr:hypothetical protein [Dyadobacter sp. MSC1_007]
MNIDNIIAGLPEQFLRSWELSDFLQVADSDVTFENAFIHDMSDNPIDCNIYHPKYGYPGFVTHENRPILTSFNPIIYQEPSGQYVYCKDHFPVTCLHVNGVITNKDGIQVKYVNHTMTNRTRLADSEDDFKKIYKREFVYAKIPNEYPYHKILTKKLKEHIEKCRKNYEENRVFIGNTAARTGDLSLIYVADRFESFLDALLNSNIDKFKKMIDIPDTNHLYLSSISSQNDYDFYYDLTKNLPNDFVQDVIDYFGSGPREGFFDPLQFLNLWHKPWEYFDGHMDEPSKFIGAVQNLDISEENKHIIFGFTLKFYGGYPIVKGDYQASVSLRLIEEAFLEYPNDTPEKTFCMRDGCSDFVPIIESEASTYLYSIKDFSNISDNHSIDFFYNVKNVPRHELVFDTVWYFKRGYRKGLVEPLAFLNLLWKQSNFVHRNLYGKVRSTFDTLNNLPLNELQKHILFGFILKWKGGIPIQVFNPDENRFYKILERAFLSFEGDTPEKLFCSKESLNHGIDLYSNQISQKGVSTDKDTIASTKSKDEWKNDFNSCQNREEIRECFIALTKLKSANGKPHLDAEQLDQFIELAFCDCNAGRKIKMNFRRGEIKRIRKVFYEFYVTSWPSYESSRNVKDKYVRLLTDYFEGFHYSATFSNFNK